MILFAKFIIDLEKETNFLFDIMRNMLNAVFVKPRFCLRVFTDKNEGTRDFVRYNNKFVKNHVC